MAPRFPFWPLLLTLSGLLGSATLLNRLIDPLWYGGGNRLNGVNFTFNERIGKLNRLARETPPEAYDCLILGSSRATALSPRRLAPQRCFNLALKGAELPEFLAYGRQATALGLRPATVYVSVDDFNFLHKQETERRSQPVVAATPGFWQAYVSADVLLFSLMTLAGVSPDPHTYYDRDFELREFPGRRYAAVELRDEADLRCDPGAVARFAELRRLFPQARLIGWVPPMTPWAQASQLASRGVLDCVLEAYHQVAGGLDALHDFALPSPLTLDPAVSYDGSHFSPAANLAVADQLMGRRQDLALAVKPLTLADYRREIRSRLAAYLQTEGRPELLP